MSSDVGTPVGTPPERADNRAEVWAEQGPLWPISRALAAALVTSLVLIGVALFALVWVLGFPGRESPKPLDTRAQLDLLKLAFAVVAGVGGIVALVTAYRRQRVAEIDSKLAQRAQHHVEQVAQDNRDDAIERRVTELYGQAVEQLGHEKAAVRLAGLYSLERLAQDHSQHRQPVIDVVCAYLRMPFSPGDTLMTGSIQPSGDSPQHGVTYARRPTERAEVQQERQVRLTAQRLLTRHLHISPDDSPNKAFSETYWEGIKIDLTEAHLINFDFRECHPHNAYFIRAAFDGYAGFEGALFHGDTRFDEALFHGDAGFVNTQFSEGASFAGAQFSGKARFGEAKFHGGAAFGKAKFSGFAGFIDASFHGDAGFVGAEFNGFAGFNKAHFNKDAKFDKAQFNGNAGFVRAEFRGFAGFPGTRFRGFVGFPGARFNGTAGFVGALFQGNAGFVEVQFQGNARFVEAQFGRNAKFKGAQFGRNVKFEKAQFHGNAGFGKAKFSGDARFVGARFKGNARFGRARFDRKPFFHDATASHPNAEHVWPGSWHVEPARSKEKMGRLTQRTKPGHNRTMQFPHTKKD